MASIKGVGILTVAVLLAETNGFVLFENCRQLVSYAGYDVVENQSGKRSGKTKISKKGNSHIRRALFMPAFSVITYEIKPFSDLFNRTFENHKIKMKSYVAVQKKLLVIMYSLWKKEVSFTDNFIETNTKEWKQESTSLVELE
jgi:transposase